MHHASTLVCSSMVVKDRWFLKTCGLNTSSIWEINLRILICYIQYLLVLMWNCWWWMNEVNQSLSNCVVLFVLPVSGDGPCYAHISSGRIGFAVWPSIISFWAWYDVTIRRPLWRHRWWRHNLVLGMVWRHNQTPLVTSEIMTSWSLLLNMIEYK